MSHHTNGLAHDDDPIHHRLLRIEMRADGYEDKLDAIQTDVLSLRVRMDRADELDATRHAELKDLTEQAIAAQRETHECIQSTLKSRLALVLGVAVLVWALDGTGLQVKLGNWLFAGPAGVSAE